MTILRSAGDQRSGMPLAVYALMIAAYAIGTTEFVAVGILPTVAADLDTTLPLAGLIVSVYALGVTLGAPILTALTGHVGRKPLVLGLLVLFVIGNSIAALSPTLPVLLVARVITAFAQGVFYSIAATIAADLVPEDRRASAIAMMFTGMTVAIVSSVPLGSVIAQNFGWRATFWAVTLLGLISLVVIAALLPSNLKTPAPVRPREQFGVLGSGRLLLAYAMTILGYGGTFVAFTYLASILTDISGFTSGEVSIILVMYGLAVAAGNYVGGKLSNKHPAKALALLFMLQAAVLVVFTFTASYPVPALVTLVALGFLSFANVPALQFYVVQLAQRYRPGAVDIASALNISAFNLGIALGAWAGGIVVGSQWGLGATPWVAGVMVFGAVLLTSWSAKLDWQKSTES